LKTYHDIVGDGGSNVVAQVESQQQVIRQALAGVGHLVAIGSGKGGVGKSTVTMALARALRRLGHSVAVFDGDLNGPCQAQLAGLEVCPWIPTEQGLQMPYSSEGIGVVSMGSLLPTARPMGFDSVATGEEQTWRGTREFAMLAQLLGAVHWGQLDFLLFDLPPGPERTRQFAQFLSTHAATAFVLVTIPSDLSRGVVARSIAALEESGGNLLGYVENMVGYYCRECGTVRPLFPPSDIPLPIERLGAIPFDPHLAASDPEGLAAETTADHDSPDSSRQEISKIARLIVRKLWSET
jgi:ATP-binding protein involved in chromosome partitioning